MAAPLGQFTVPEPVPNRVMEWCSVQVIEAFFPQYCFFLCVLETVFITNLLLLIIQLGMSKRSKTTTPLLTGEKKT